MKKLIVGLMFAAVAVGAGEFRVEAENFQDLKSWLSQTDGRAVGKKVIRSNAKGPGNTIVGTFSCPEAGKYYVWIRTLDTGENSRKTEVKVNQVVLGKFGDANKPPKNAAYFWNKSKITVDLPVGDFTVTLIPATSYSRIDSIVFTTDEAFTPSDNPRAAEDILEIDAK